MVVCALSLTTACSAVGGSDAIPEVTVAEGWSVEVVREDLRGPTQIATGPDGTLYAAQLSGGEGSGDGQVVRLVAGEEPQVVLDGLLKPTGLAITADAVWVQLEDVVVRAPFDGATAGAPEEVPATRLPNNGRSQGTLTLLPDGRLLHLSTGTGSGPEPAEGSGVLYALDPADGVAATPEPLATGFKNAYAQVLVEPVVPDPTSGVASAGVVLFVTEIGDGTYDGEQPPDELVVIPVDAGSGPTDAGWPRCVGSRPVEQNGGTAAACEGTRPPLALFAPRATPTSVAVLANGNPLVALWNEGRVVEVLAGADATSDVLSGVDQPQHLLADGDGGFLLTVFGSSALWRLTPPA